MAEEVRLRATKDIPGIKARLADSGYRTRRLKAGDEFYVDGNMAKLLVDGIKKAERQRVPGKVAAPPASVTAKAATAYRPQLDHDNDGENGGGTSGGNFDDMAGLRAEYLSVIGRRPYNGWDAATLREKIAAAK